MFLSAAGASPRPTVGWDKRNRRCTFVRIYGASSSVAFRATFPSLGKATDAVTSWEQTMHLRMRYGGGSKPPPYGKGASPRHLRMRYRGRFVNRAPLRYAQLG